MSCHNDTPDLDVDSPIAYELTECGRRTLLDWDIEHHAANCHHEWTGGQPGTVRCRHCGQVRQLDRPSSSAAYAPVRGRYEK